MDHASLAPLFSILRQIDGLPLGIVLAAGWVELLSLTEIEGEIAKTLDFLETESRNIPERQQSMRAVFNYSWALLTDNHQMIYGKLSVFCGGLTRDAAQVVAGADLRALNMPVNKSLLRRNPNNGRFEIHELLRQYAAEKCAQADNSPAVKDAHSSYYLNFMQHQHADQLELEMENVRVAWSHALDRKDFNAIRRAMGGLIPVDDKT